MPLEKDDLGKHRVTYDKQSHWEKLREKDQMD